MVFFIMFFFGYMYIYIYMYIDILKLCFIYNIYIYNPMVVPVKKKNSTALPSKAADGDGAEG